MTARSMSSWEGWGSSWQQVGAADEVGGLDPAEVDYNEITAEEAGSELVAMLLHLKLVGELSATVACQLAWWAARAGACGEASKLGMPPGKSSGAYSKHYDTFAKAGCGSVREYPLPLSRRLRFEASRHFKPLPMRLPHEVLATELIENPKLTEDLKAAIRTHDLPQAYFQHPAVVAAQDDTVVHPFCLYMDAVPFTRRDSVLGVFVQLLLSQKRHLVFSIRRSEMCSCGCRGLCSLMPLFAALAWDLETMLKGVYPHTRHDGGPLTAADAGLADKIGLYLGFVAAALFIKADWAEWSHTLGLPSWSEILSPCPLCFATSHELDQCEGYSSAGMPKEEKTLVHYEVACAECEVVTVLDVAAITMIKPKLTYEKRQGQSRGRVLREDVPMFGLLKGDRLVMTKEYPDVAEFHSGQAPRRTLWWRSKNETLAKFRNPLFCKETGLTPLSLGIDWLHALSLGVFQVILAHLIWRLFSANAFEVPGTSTNLAENSLTIFKQILGDWYKAEAKAGRAHSQIDNLQMGMLGKKDDPVFNAHGAETNACLRFAHEVLLPRYGAKLGPSRVPFERGVGSLVRILDMIRKYERVVPPAEAVLFCDHVLVHMRSLATLKIKRKPKHHMLMELGARRVVSHFSCGRPRCRPRNDCETPHTGAPAINCTHQHRGLLFQVRLHSQGSDFTDRRP
jgi:hypothetical protein